MPTNWKLGISVVVLSSLHSVVQAVDIETYVKASSDYVYRGISQSHGNPVLQVAPKVSLGYGFHLMGFASPVDFGGENKASFEYDGAVGLERKNEYFYWSTRVWRFNYRGQNALNSTEFRSFVSYKKIDFTYGYTFDMSHTGDSAHHLEIGFTQPVDGLLSARIGVGHSFFSSNKIYADHYHAKASLFMAVKGTIAEVAYSNTLQGNYGDNSGGRAFLSISHTF